MHTTEYSLGLCLLSLEVCLIFETQRRKERGAVTLLNAHTSLLPLLTRARPSVQLFVYATWKRTHGAYSFCGLNSGVPPSCLIFRRILLPPQTSPQICLLTYLSHSSQWVRTYSMNSLTHTKVARSAKLSDLWHLLHNSQVQIRVHEIIMNRGLVHKVKTKRWS